MSRLLRLEDIDAFTRAASIRPELVLESVLKNVMKLDERTQIEPWLRHILHQPYMTAHTPAEIADILTTTVSVNEKPRLMAFINKGKACKRITGKDVAHQFLKAVTIPGLEVIVFLATGVITDEAFRDFTHVATQSGCDFLVINTLDVARIFISYGKICPNDGKPLDAYRCSCGFEYDTDKVFRHFAMGDRVDPSIIELAVSEGRVINGTFSSFGFTVTKMPCVQSYIYLPRLDQGKWVNFLVDTGASQTCLGPIDCISLSVTRSKLRKSTLHTIVGIGGYVEMFSESAILIFRQQDNEILTYRCTIELPSLTRKSYADNASTFSIPSLLGRDVLAQLSVYMNLDKDELHLIPKAYNQEHITGIDNLEISNDPDN